VPDDIVAEVMKTRLEQHDWNFGFVLDGYPASQSQADFFLESYDLDGVILLEVADSVLTERLTRFRICEACGFDPNLIYAQPRSDAVCEVCGSELASRNSESPGAIEERLREFHTKTEPVIDLLRQRELVVKVDATKPTSEIHDFVRASLGLASEAMAQRLRSSISQATHGGGSGTG
jgi:adenylate kinase